MTATPAPQVDEFQNVRLEPYSMKDEDGPTDIREAFGSYPEVPKSPDDRPTTRVMVQGDDGWEEL